MNYDSTIKALKDKYGEEFNTSILCLLDNYYPLIAKNIMQELGINDDRLRKCSVIYNDLGVSNSSKNDYSNTDNPLEISPSYLRKFIDNLVFRYNKIKDKEEKINFIDEIIKPLLISDISNNSSLSSDKKQELLSVEDIIKDKTSLIKLLDKIYELGKNNKIKNVFLSSKEVKLVELIYSVMFQDSNSHYLDKLVEDIYNELVHEGTFETQIFGMKDKEELIKEFINELHKRINSSKNLSSKDKEYARRQASRIVPKKVLQQSYNRNNVIKKFKEMTEAERFFDIYFRDALRKYKNHITPDMTLEDFCKLLDKNNYRSGLSYSKLYKKDRNTSGFIEEFEKAKSSILNIKESLKGYLQKNKLKEVFPVNAYFDEYLKIAIDKYKDHIKPDMTLKEFCEILDKKGLEPVSDVSYTFVYEIEKNNKRFGAIEKKFEEVKSSLFKKEESLKRYLEKRLTINSKEAELIESVVKKYIKMKSGVK